MQRYNFYEFSGFLLVEKLLKIANNPIDFSKPLDPDASIDFSTPIDFSTRTKKSLSGIIKSVDVHNDNAMFYQAKRCLQELAEVEEANTFQNIISKWNVNALRNIFIYIDFSELFPYTKYAKSKFHWTKTTPVEQKKENINSCAKIIETFFVSGFDILFDENEKPVHFVPFEKSASMARNGHMIFIDSRLYERMEQRIRLGFNFSGDEISVSKLYAYTGLYLSDAKRINETSDFRLNEETVIVLADNIPKVKGNEKKKSAVPIEVISGDEKGVSEEDGFQKWPVRKYAAEEYKTSINYFDGEGLISSEYCAAINDILHSEYGMSGTAASLQIRMPFTKGMLHHVDFHKFICEKLHLESCKDVWIKDAYGISRNLEKAQIILTQSMFKIDKWLTNSKISSVRRDENNRMIEDPLALYFRRFHEYDHAFHVGITDMNLSQAGKTKLNYQFLNTLALTDEEFNEIVNEQVRFATFGTAKDILQNSISDNINDYEDTSFDDDVKENETWCEVAARNPAFLKDPKVKGMLKGVRYSLLKDIGRGRLTVGGSTKFLSRDLLALLSFMIGKIVVGSIVSKEQIYQARSEIKKEQLWTTRFFAADCVPGNPVFNNRNRKLHLHEKAYYGLLRSPHLSRNEQCSLSPFIPHKNGIYSRYFGHLKGILMVPQFSFVPQALGGADFDGDLVKLITDKRINRAINDACYHPDPEEKNDKTGERRKMHVRKLPIIMIPDTPPRTTRLPEGMVDFQTLQDTFSSKVGQLSNRAFYLGKREYDERNPNPVYDLNCETGTILVGLEIDAAKTGCHPYLNDYLPEERDNDYFIARKEEIDKLPKKYTFEVKEYPETQGTVGNISRHHLAAVTQYGPNTGKKLIKAVFTEDYDGFYRIDQLPHRFLKELSTYKDSSVIEDKEDGIQFVFEKKIDWKNQVSDPERIGVVKELIYSYRRILETARNVFRIEERLRKSNYAGCIKTIFKIQHKELINDDQITNLQEKIFSQLLVPLDSYQATQKALSKLVKDRQWQFYGTDAEKKNSYVENRLFNSSGMKLSGEVQNALNNYRWNGYFLLYYYIKDIMLYYYDTETEIRITQGEDLDKLSKYPSRFYEEFRQIYEQALAEKESKKIWQKRVIEKCRNVLKEAFPDRVDTAMMYVHKLRNCDQYGTFFWDVFNADEILLKSGGVSHA